MGMQENKIKDRLSRIDDSKLGLDLFEHSLNGISECLAICDLDNHILFANKSFLTTYCYNREKILGLSIEKLNSPKNKDFTCNNLLLATINGGWTGELYNKKNDGNEFLISLRTTLIKNDNEVPIAYLYAARDLTEEVKTRQALKFAEQNYRKLFWELKDTVFESTPDGRLLDINPAGLELFGYDTIDELLNANVGRDFYVNPDDRKKFVSILEKDGHIKNWEFNYKKKNGNTGILLETAFAVKNESGKITSYRGILRDITEIKKAGQELQNLNASKDKFFSIIAHDLRSPFGSLLSFSEFLMEDIDELSKSEIKLFATKINESSQAVYKLLDNLLQWSRIQTDRIKCSPSEHKLKKMIEQCLEIMNNKAASKDIAIHNNVDDDIDIFADDTMINSVLHNLITNALKFTHNGGNVKISADKSNGMVAVTISDDGVGITDENISKLFCLDKQISTTGTANEEGTGLGLLICKELINRNGGNITVKSKEGEGTAFTFTVPAKL